MGRVMDTSYHQCKTTEDGAYLIPDEIYVIPRKHSELDINSEIINNWMDYTSSTASSVNEQVSFLPFLNGKFSTDSQRVRTHQANDKTVTARIQVRNSVYTVKASASFQLDSRFKQQLLAIGSHLENNHSSAASYFTEMLIVNYGTHVLTNLDAGANLLQEDQVKQTFVSDTRNSKSSVTASVGISFFQKVNVGAEGSDNSTDQFTKRYVANRTHSRIESHGGLAFYPGITLHKWQESIGNRLVAIDRSGPPLHVFINPLTLPELPEPTVYKVSRAVERAIALYYTVNTHRGCVSPDSPNFDFKANVDDHSCESAATNFTLGGLYQDCAAVSGVDAQSLCQTLQQRNPLTGGLSCPEGFTAVRLGSQVLEQSYSRYECRRRCDSCYLLLECCEQTCGDIYRVRRARFTAYWCAAHGPVPRASGLMFGGLYTRSSDNPLTGSRSCPPAHYPLSLFLSLKVCVSDDSELGFRYSVPFGGFFSCESGNPLADTAPRAPPGSLQSFVQPPPRGHSQSCPRGFSQHLATVSQSCQVLYCVKAGVFTGGKLPPVHLPPFSRPPGLTSTDTDTDTVLVLGESRPWVRVQGSHAWRRTEAAQGDPGDQGREASPRAGAAVGIAVAVAVAVLLLMGFAMYRIKRSRSRGYRALGTPQAPGDEHSCGSYGTTEADSILLPGSQRATV
uniref:Macrophage expressed 1 n=2 Tax=Callorhinchus milii TaxID=7868 RepID=A0A4W3GS73_CALMI